MAKDGEKERIDPKSYLIIDGELFLFYEYYFKDKKEKWLESKSNLKKQLNRIGKRLRINSYESLDIYTINSDI